MAMATVPPVAPGASMVMMGGCAWALALEPNTSPHRTSKNDNDPFPIFLLMSLLLFEF